MLTCCIHRLFWRAGRLSSRNPDFEEISCWYTGWKQELDGELLAVPTIQMHLSRMLDLMSRAVSGESTAAPPRHHRPPPVSMPTAPAPASAGVPSAQMTVKDLVQQIADQHGLEFVPKPNLAMVGVAYFAPLRVRHTPQLH